MTVYPTKNSFPVYTVEVKPGRSCEPYSGGCSASFTKPPTTAEVKAAFFENEKRHASDSKRMDKALGIRRGHKLRPIAKRSRIELIQRSLNRCIEILDEIGIPKLDSHCSSVSQSAEGPKCDKCGGHDDHGCIWVTRHYVVRNGK